VLTATGRSILAAAFLIIFVAAFGDKTQIAVTGSAP
jgi:putative Ca2+/H+ antiporter (TMEM165/GDT1 family)